MAKKVIAAPAQTTTANEYTTVGRFLGYKVEDSDTVCLRGLVTIEGCGYEVTLFYAKDEDIAFAEEKGWNPPFAGGSAKDNKDTKPDYWIKAYIPESPGAIALKLQINDADDKTNKLYLNLFYVKGSDMMLEGNVQAKVPF